MTDAEIYPPVVPPLSDNDPPLSPRSLAAAAVAEATAQRRDRDGTSDNFNLEDQHGAAAVVDSLNIENTHADLSELDDLHYANLSRQQINQRNKCKLLEDSIMGYWDDAVIDSNSKSNDLSVKEAFSTALEQTKEILFSQVEDLVHMGIDSFRCAEQKEREMFLLQEAHDMRAREVKRLRAGDEANRASVSNLLRAIESSKSETRDLSRHAQIESRLRAEISTMREQNDKLTSSNTEFQRKVSLLEEEVRLVKTKLTRVAQEKVKMERDARATISLARSLDSHANSDSDFYKRKVAELNDRLQAKNALVAEQQQQLDEMRRQMERSLSQSRMAQLRSEGVGGKRLRR